ncbi:MAG: hypothetical protein FJZ16_02575 [Candidatus Omnitrophica bacterium]|nr:hypothetical protein [Candidatus Omnitrophota bacterium]
MKFLIDENICLEVIEYLNAQGYDVKKVPSGIKNGEVIKLALKDKRILITSDVHFSNILMYPPHKYCGIIRLKIHPPSAKKEIAAIKRLLLKFPSFTHLNKRLLVLEETDLRIRK